MNWLGAVSRTAAGALLAALLAVSPVAADEGDVVMVATHNIEANYEGAMNYVVDNEPYWLIGIALQEVCAHEYKGSGRELWDATLPAEGYTAISIVTTATGSSACGGNQLLNVVATWAYTGPTGLTYPTSMQSPDAPNERRGYICARASFGYDWITCSTHLEFRNSGSYAVLQSNYLRAALGNESNFRRKFMAGDFNARPRASCTPAGSSAMHANYTSYREADQLEYDVGVCNSTRNPPADYVNQKIDYVFADRFWHSNLFGQQDRRCETGSDHCLVIGAYIAN